MIIPLAIIYFFVFVGLLFAANKHGKTRSNENFWTTLIAFIIQLCLIWWALGWKFW
jgi:hypothetical protein